MSANRILSGLALAFLSALSLARAAPLPEVPLEQVEIELTRSICFGTCPSYSLLLRGDGTATYVGHAFVDVEGKHDYGVAPSEVAGLVEMIRREQLWSLRGEYRAQVTDHPTQKLRLRFGGEERVIVDYEGRSVGMPEGVTRVEKEIDRIGRASDWTQLSMAAIEALMREGFDFHSTAAGELLTRAIANQEIAREGVVERLLTLGAPIDAPVDMGLGEVGESSLEDALATGRTGVVELLIAHGALDVDGERSQEKIDAAFRAAIRAGRLAPVQAIWAAHGSAKPPALVYDEQPGNPKLPAHKTSVSLLLERPYPRERPWEAVAIARWLRAQGVDLAARAADGDTLLHHAVRGGDADFVRFLLQAGLDPDARGESRLTPLGSVDEEEVALALLEGGADPYANDHTEPGSATWRGYVNNTGWKRVLAWLDAHPRAQKR